MVSSVRLTEGGPAEFHALMSTRFSCSQVTELPEGFSCLPATAVVSLGSSPHRLLHKVVHKMAAGFHENQQEQERADKKDQSLCNLILKVTSITCHILGPVYTQGESTLSKGMNNRRQGSSGAILEAAYHDVSHFEMAPEVQHDIPRSVTKTTKKIFLRTKIEVT